MESLDIGAFDSPGNLSDASNMKERSGICSRNVPPGVGDFVPATSFELESTAGFVAGFELARIVPKISSAVKVREEIVVSGAAAGLGLGREGTEEEGLKMSRISSPTELVTVVGAISGELLFWTAGGDAKRRLLPPKTSAAGALLDFTVEDGGVLSDVPKLRFSVGGGGRGTKLSLAKSSSRGSRMSTVERAFRSIFETI
mmetsp:Transcript_1811/g.3557  ORF Transcript_1811/g.3557 Transcript_1811/m.3557 type:complete len:200 (-) Transcript_1811:260-859(-)